MKDLDEIDDNWDKNVLMNRSYMKIFDRVEILFVKTSFN
jgi:hypothetical protein